MPSKSYNTVEPSSFCVMKNKSNDHSPREDYMQEECLHLNKIKQGNMRGSHYWLSYPSSLQSGIIPDKSGVSKLQLHLQPFMPGDSCLWFRFLKESFLNPVKWLQKKSKFFFRISGERGTKPVGYTAKQEKTRID